MIAYELFWLIVAPQATLRRMVMMKEEEDEDLSSKLLIKRVIVNELF